MVQHTFGQWGRCKTCLLGLLKMPQNVLLQCLTTQGNLLSNSQNYLSLVSQYPLVYPSMPHWSSSPFPGRTASTWQYGGGMGRAPWLSPQVLEGHHCIRRGDCLVFGGTGTWLVPDLCQVDLLHLMLKGFAVMLKKAEWQSGSSTQHGNELNCRNFLSLLNTSLILLFNLNFTVWFTK